MIDFSHESTTARRHHAHGSRDASIQWLRRKIHREKRLAVFAGSYREGAGVLARWRRQTRGLRVVVVYLLVGKRRRLEVAVLGRQLEAAALGWMLRVVLLGLSGGEPTDPLTLSHTSPALFLPLQRACRAFLLVHKMETRPLDTAHPNCCDSKLNSGQRDAKSNTNTICHQPNDTTQRPTRNREIMVGHLVDPLKELTHSKYSLVQGNLWGLAQVAFANRPCLPTTYLPTL